MVKEPPPADVGVKIAPEKMRSAVVVEMIFSIFDLSASSIIDVEEGIEEDKGEFIEELEEDGKDNESAEGRICNGTVGISSEC